MSPNLKALAKDTILRAIETAEVVSDPLAGLVERTARNAGAPFATDVLQALAVLKRDEPAAFETLRANLKAAGCRVTALDAAIDGESSDRPARGPNQADILIGLALPAALFHDAEGRAYADLVINGSRQTVAVRGGGFRDWLLREYFKDQGGAPNADALQSALSLIEAKARYDAPERPVYLRVGGHDGKLYLDLCDSAWRAVEIDPSGWRVVDSPPVRFRRTKGMQALPAPEPGGSIDTLRRFLNVETDADFVLVVSWLLAAFRTQGPYPVLAVSGEQGAAKSTFTAMIRALIDPNMAALRPMPRDERDMFVAANNSHVMAFDNVSAISPTVSDTLCRLATGGGFAARQLYSDQDEVLFYAVRPVILNGIEEVVARADLADRALFLKLLPIPDDRRRPEAELRSAFETERPRILGVLLDAVAKGLAELPRTKLDKLPRMADFAVWATACETALWPSGTFSAAYSGNREAVVDDVIDADPVAAAVRALMQARTGWAGSATDLLAVLASLIGDRAARSSDWPSAPQALSRRLTRAATVLRKVGIATEFIREGHYRSRIIRITNVGAGSDNEEPSASSAPSADAAKAK